MAKPEDDFDRVIWESEVVPLDNPIAWSNPKSNPKQDLHRARHFIEAAYEVGLNPNLEHRMECVSCSREFDPIKYRWLCPYCKTKNSCCEGAPQ